MGKSNAPFQFCISLGTLLNYSMLFIFSSIAATLQVAYRTCAETLNLDIKIHVLSEQLHIQNVLLQNNILLFDLKKNFEEINSKYDKSSI